MDQHAQPPRIAAEPLFLEQCRMAWVWRSHDIRRRHRRRRLQGGSDAAAGDPQLARPLHDSQHSCRFCPYKGSCCGAAKALGGRHSNEAAHLIATTVRANDGSSRATGRRLATMAHCHTAFGQGQAAPPHQGRDRLAPVSGRRPVPRPARPSEHAGGSPPRRTPPTAARRSPRR